MDGNGLSEPAIRVVSSPVVRRAFQIREAEEYGASFCLPVMTPGELVRSILTKIPKAARIATATEEMRILWSVTQDALKDGPFSVSPLAMPSFVSRLLKTLRQLKQFDLHGMSLDRVSRGLGSSHLRRRWEFLASVYSRYDEALENRRLVGDVGVFHYVARRLTDSIVESLRARRILLHYLVDVTPAQAVLFSALREKGLEVRMVMPDIPALDEPEFEARLRSLLRGVDFEIEARSPDRPLLQEVVAPTPSEEMRWLARLTRGILRSGASPHSVLILYRRPILPPEEWRRHFTDFSVPIAGEESESALSSVVRLILTLADLVVNDFPRRSMAVFLSAFFQARGLPESRLQDIFAPPSEEDLGDEERLAPIIWRGYERWRARVASIPDVNDVLSLMDEIRKVQGKTPEEFVWMCQKICREIFAEVPDAEEALEPAAESLLLLLKMARDAGASESQTLDVLRRLEWVSRAEGGLEPGRVGWGTFPEMVGVSADHILLAGVTDSEVPAPAPTPFVLSESDRYAVNRLLDREIFLTPESHLLRERLFLESAVAAARVSLVISRHAWSGNTPQYESPLWHLLKAIRYPGQATVKTYTFRRSLLPEPADVESLDDALRATAAYPHPSPPPLLKEKQAEIEDAIGGDLQRLRNASLVEGFDGVLPREAIPEFFVNLGASERTPASPTLLAGYGKCPFIFFARTVLNLADLPEEDVPATLTLGTLVHRVLENAIQPIIRNEATWSRFPDLVAEQIEKTFAEVHTQTFAGNLDALKRALIRFAQHEAATMEALARGEGFRKVAGRIIIQPVGTEQVLAGWVTGESGKFYLEGRTDRIDRVDGDSGTRTGWLLTDYKSGTSPEPARLRQSLQLPLYAHLFVLQQSEATLDQIGYRYVSVTRCEAMPALSTALTPGASTEKFTRVVAAANGIIQRIRAGYFTPFPAFGDLFPGKQRVPQRLRRAEAPCNSCAYLPVCRISLLDGVRKDLSPFGFTPEEKDAALKSQPPETVQEYS